jgi:tRNA pseudouridine55 synthase
MARRAVSGWLVLDKPAGMSSAQAVAKLRWAFHAEKVGHAGTLDPDATGVLAIAFGQATKTIPFVMDGAKSYRFGVTFGLETSTDDAAGEVTVTAPKRPTNAEIAAALPAFRGDILQIPPQISAVKVSGERAYDLARSGQVLDLAARPLHVATLELSARPDPDHAEFDFVCGKGGYVRAIARDLGRALGTAAHVGWLRRLATGPFDIAAAISLDQVIAAETGTVRDALLLPVETGLAALPRVEATEEGLRRLQQGGAGTVTGAEGLADGARAWAAWNGSVAAIGRVVAGRMVPDRVFPPAQAGTP